jgi:hypothetical protein
LKPLEAIEPKFAGGKIFLDIIEWRSMVWFLFVATIENENSCW